MCVCVCLSVSVSVCLCVSLYVHVHVEVRGQPVGGREFCSFTIRIPGIELKLPALAAKAFTTLASHQLPLFAFLFVYMELVGVVL